MGASMKIRTELCRKAVLLLAALSAPAFATDSIVFGPIESVSIQSGEIAVLGHKFAFGNATSICSTANDGWVSQSVEAGSAAFISGRRDADGSLSATNICFASAAYVAGASDVLVEGIISAFDFNLAIVQIGGASINLGSIADLSATDLSIGARLVVRGRQTTAGGSIWASEISNVAGFDAGQLSSASEQIWSRPSDQSSDSRIQALSITGTGKQSITGTGIQSITGTGKQSITGTGIQSITGTGKQSITGTGIQSITGTGKQSITGTGIQSITGTGTQSITGTGRISTAF
jgi:hypothetical protein